MQVTLGTYTTTPAIRAAVSAVLDSGRLSYGPVSRQYEQRFAEMHGCGYGVVSNSGTSSLVVALQALKELHGWRDGDEVIVPALTFVATVNAVLHNRLTPVLVDIDPLTFNIDTDLIGDAITNRTRCIMPVHLFGQPANMAMVRGLAKIYNLSVIEDSCETMLATFAGHPVGSLGDIGCFSTYTAHLLVTGVGGMATTNNPDYAQTMRSLVNHGIDLTELPNGQEYDPTFLARKFRFVRAGHSFRMTELEAAIGLAQLDDLPCMIEKRRANGEYLRTALKQHELFTQMPEQNTTHSWMVFPMVLNEHLSKWDMMRHLQARGIECREMLPLTSQPCYGFDETAYPVAAWVNRCGLYVGCHQDLTGEQLDYMIQAIGGFLRNER